MKIPRPLINDPGLVSLKSAARAAPIFAFAERRREPNLDFEQFVKALKRRGKL